MRKSSFTGGLICILALCNSVQAQGFVLAPHRAVYDIAIGQSKSGINRIATAHGRLVYEFTGSACEGYTTTLRFVTHILPQEAGEENPGMLTDMRSSTFETGDGAQMQFHTITYQNNMPQSRADGAAQHNKERSQIKLKKPKPHEMAMSPDTVFPAGQLMGILAAAQSNKKIYGVDLYDGSEGGKKVFTTLATIKPPIEGAVTPSPNMRFKALAHLKRWPVTIAFFEHGQKGEGTPFYELSTDLYENGVSHHIRLDYPDFALNGTMSRFDLLQSKPCP